MEIPENDTGFVVGVFQTIGPNSNFPIIYNYSLVSGEGGDDIKKFEIIDGNNLITTIGLNYTIQPSSSIRARTTDQQGFLLENFHLSAVRILFSICIIISLLLLL